MIIGYQKISKGDYDWSALVATDVADDVLSGTVVHGAPGWGTGGWIATIVHVNGEPLKIPEGGRLSGFASTRAEAVRRVLESYNLGESGRWLRLMNT